MKYLPTLFLAAIFVSCATVSQHDSSTLAVSPAITKATALHTALREVAKRKLPLPIDYQTNVSDSFVSQEMGPTIPVFTIVLFSISGRKRVDLYQVAVNRHDGEIQYFLNLLRVTPSN
jgi:pyrrolidone-carboxylate peptidase